MSIYTIEIIYLAYIIQREDFTVLTQIQISQTESGQEEMRVFMRANKDVLHYIIQPIKNHTKEDFQAVYLTTRR